MCDRFFQTTEFKGVVFAGGSARMLEPLAKGVSKAMIPVCNRPMIWYPLSNLVKHRIREIYVFCEDQYREILNDYISETFSSEKVIERFEFEETYRQNIKVVGLKEDENTIESLGTWSILAEYGKELLGDSDFFLLTCDVIGSLDLIGLANKHRLSQAVCSIMLTESQIQAQNKGSGANQGSSGNSKAVPNFLGGISVELQRDKNKTIFVLDEKEEIVLFARDFYSAREEDEAVEISKLQLFWHPQVSLRTDLVDTHVYLFKSSVFKILELTSRETEKSSRTIQLPEDGIESVRLELIPFLAKSQHIPGSELWGRSKFDCNYFPDEENTPQQSFSGLKFTKASLPPKVEGTSVSYFLQKDPQPPIRVNTIIALHECNLAGTSSANFPSWLSNEAEVTGVGKEVIMGSNGKIGKNVQLRRSVIGAGVSIGDGSKIVNCIIFDGVRIGSKCTIQNSIIASHSEIGDSCKISHSVVEKSFRIESGSKSQGEILEKRDDLFEIKI
ncbi:putative eukaryotic initiation factor-2B, gamma subunit [Cryptosporidium felis]|nr:putative eukaryotic initiation factor-2B, gamma subunit [Cryptosporidium felis]